MTADFLRDSDNSRTPSDSTLNAYVINALNHEGRLGSTEKTASTASWLRSSNMEPLPELKLASGETYYKSIAAETAPSAPPETAKVKTAEAAPVSETHQAQTKHTSNFHLDRSLSTTVLGSTALLGGAASQMKGGLGDLGFDYNLAKISVAANPRTLAAMKWLSVPTAAASIYSFSKDENAFVHHVPHSGEACAADLVALAGAGLAFNKRTAPFAALVQMAGLGARVAIGKLDANDGNPVTTDQSKPGDILKT